MTKVPRITAAKLIKVLVRKGFHFTRQEGSHKIYRNAAGVRATVPDHAGKTIHPKIIKAILADTGWSLEEFIEAMTG
jgi:predicted RNA binding protein YcfA (HicA-like mRNA interferase family)